MRNVVPSNRSLLSSAVECQNWQSHIDIVDGLAQLQGQWLWVFQFETGDIYLSNDIPAGLHSAVKDELITAVDRSSLGLSASPDVVPESLKEVQHVATIFDDYGSAYRIQYSYVVFVDDKGVGQGVVGTVGLDSKAHCKPNEVERLTRQFDVVFESASEGMMITSPNKRIERVNSAFTAITGFSEDESLGQSPSILRSEKHDADFYKLMWQRIDSTGHWDGEIWNRRKNGELYAQWLSISAVKNGAGEVINYIGTFSDISEIRRTAKEIEFLNHYDRVTGLQNVDLMRIQMQQQLIGCNYKTPYIGVLCLNLDRFRQVISTYGYEVGDKVLAAVGRLINEKLPSSANVTRLNGDTFAVSLIVPLVETFQCYVNDIQAALRQGLVIDELGTLSLSGSCGISVYPRDGQEPSELLRNAESAMGTAKATGRGMVAFYQPHMTEDAVESLAIEQEIKSALLNEEFELHFQPIVNIGDAKIVAAEALIRWRQADGRYKSPAVFMPVVEGCDLVEDVNLWVVNTAVNTLRKWQQAGLDKIKLSINVSSASLSSGCLSTYIQNALKAAEVSANLLEIEILENVFFDHPEIARKEIQTIRNLGVVVALDDFGTGFSSLSYLQRFEIDYLKIDRSFVSSVTDSAQSHSIVRSTIAMAHSMGIKTIAEGIETDKQMELLVSQGCDMLQGYRIAKPMPYDQLLTFYTENKDGLIGEMNSLLRHSVLVVDDNDDMRFLLREQLEELGWVVFEAADGNEGLAILASRHVEAVISDYLMPDINGIEFLSEVKSKFPDVNRVIVSSVKDQKTVIEAINRAGINGFMVKPWSEQELVQALNV